MVVVVIGVLIVVYLIDVDLLLVKLDWLFIYGDSVCIGELIFDVIYLCGYIFGLIVLVFGGLVIGGVI